MLDAARTAFTDLGSRLGLLETAVHAGQVELLAGDPAAAEGYLRGAIAGFDTLGARVASARATALLARALLELDRVEEAETIADPSLAGGDLQAAIGLLGVRAEVLARSGRTAEADDLALRAVQLAEPTDALVDHADARLARARVLAASGRGPEAETELARAFELYMAKGSVVGARRTGLDATGAVKASAPFPAATRNAAAALAELDLARLNSGILPDETICGPGYVVEDHVMHLVQDLDSVRATIADTIDQITGHFYRELVATIGDRYALHRYGLAATATSSGASSIDTSRFVVVSLDDSGRFGRCHSFGPDDGDLALATMNQLHGSSPAAVRRIRHNLATACMARWAAAMRIGDTSAVLAAHAPGYINVHHRVQDALSFADQRDEELEIAGRSTVETEVLATLGDRHALHRVRMEWSDDTLQPRSEPARGLAGDVTYDLLLVSRTDRDGADLHDDMFEAEQLALAVACLVERWADDELGGDDRARAMQWAEGWHYAETINAHDWERRESQLSNDIVLIDHRPATVGDLRGSAAVTDWERTAVEAADRISVQLLDILALTENATLVRGVTTGSVHEGSFEIRSLIAASCGPDGRFDRLEYFAEDHPAAAWAAFERMERVVPLPHPALALRRRWATAAAAGALETVRAMYIPDARTEDRRPGAQMTVSGDDAHLANAVAIPSGTSIELEELASFGSRVALLRVTFRTSADDLIEWLMVQQVDASCTHFEHAVIVTATDLDAAHRALAERAELVAGRADHVVRAIVATMLAWSTGDADRLRAGFIDGCSIVDHRPEGFETVSVDEYIARCRTLFEKCDYTSARVVEAPTIATWGVLARVEECGRWTAGADFEMVQWAVECVDRGKITSLHLFPIGERAAAEACLEGLRPNALVDHGACQWMLRWADAVRARDLEALGALYQADAVVEDSRRLMQDVFRGPAENVRNIGAVMNIAGTNFRFETELLATRTDRLGLFRNTFRLETGEVQILFVVQLDEASRLLEWGAVYGAVDVDDAYIELDERSAGLAGDTEHRALGDAGVLGLPRTVAGWRRGDDHRVVDRDRR